MSGESKIILALAQFKSDYAWDKSLSTPPVVSLGGRAARHVSSSECLEDFVRSQQAAAQSDHS